jgi:hypothetical protein
MWDTLPVEYIKSSDMVLNNLMLIAEALLVMGVVLAGMILIWRALIAYRITDRDITVLLFHILPVYHIPFDKIKRIHEAPFYEVAFVPGMHFFTRPFARRVVIEMRDRWVIFAFLTPDNPVGFIADVKKHLVGAFG